MMLLVGAVILGFTSCDHLNDQGSDLPRDLTLIGNAQSDTTASIVALHRQLIERLVRNLPVDDLVTWDFSIQDPALDVTNHAGPIAPSQRVDLLHWLGATARPDSGLALRLGRRTSSEYFRVLVLDDHQIAIVADAQDEPTVLSNWLKQGNGWKAQAVYLNPTESQLSKLHEIWRTRGARN